MLYDIPRENLTDAQIKWMVNVMAWGFADMFGAQPGLVLEGFTARCARVLARTRTLPMSTATRVIEKKFFNMPPIVAHMPDGLRNRVKRVITFLDVIEAVQQEYAGEETELAGADVQPEQPIPLDENPADNIAPAITVSEAEVVVVDGGEAVMADQEVQPEPTYVQPESVESEPQKESSEIAVSAADDDSAGTVLVKRKRGRPRKYRP